MKLPNINIVDAHSETYIAWHGAFENQSADLLHIDAHHDLFTHAKVRREPIETYTKNLLIGNFIIPAIYEKTIGDVYWTYPIGKEVIISALKNPKLYVKNDVLLEEDYDFFRENLPAHNNQELINTLNNSKKPLILDIDLDAFDLVDHKLSDLEVKANINTTFDLLSYIKKPDHITIARSQTPYAFVSPSKIDGLQKEVLERLSYLYQK